jgi:CHAD domain-containing protein
MAGKPSHRAAAQRLALLDREPAEGVRVVALELLADAKTAAERMRDPEDADALHDFRVAVRRLRSWLRSFAPEVNDTLRKKWRRALKAAAGATGPARDAEVMRARVLSEREALSSHHRRAADWFLERVAPSDPASEPRAELAKSFESLAPHLEDGLSRYERKVGATVRGRFGQAWASALRAQHEALFTALAAIGGPGDVDNAHRARIEGKRLRYLLEPLRQQLSPMATVAVSSTKDLQDLLGELHDVHVLAARIADAVAEAAAEEARAVHHALHAEGEGRARSVARRSTRPGMAALDRRIRAQRDALHALLSRDWLLEGARTVALGEQVESVVAALKTGAVER